MDSSLDINGLTKNFNLFFIRTKNIKMFLFTGQSATVCCWQSFLDHANTHRCIHGAQWNSRLEMRLCDAGSSGWMYGEAHQFAASGQIAKPLRGSQRKVRHLSSAVRLSAWNQRFFSWQLSKACHGFTYLVMTSCVTVKLRRPSCSSMEISVIAFSTASQATHHERIH